EATGSDLPNDQQQLAVGLVPEVRTTLRWRRESRANPSLNSPLAGSLQGISSKRGLVARRFAHDGARVFITGRHQSQLDQAVGSTGGDAGAILEKTALL